MMESQTFSQKTAVEIEIDALEKGKKAAVEIQEETVMLVDDQSGSIHSFLTSPNSLPNSMEGLDEAGGPPPFLKKLLKIVEDPQTDSIISWSDSKESFIVWDNHAFSENILPNYFKHSNFSSFIYQLNTYGFKKMHSDRWEYANEGFQGGKEHLLKTIKRRSKHLQQGGTAKRKRLHSEQSYMEAKLEELKNNLKKMKKEIVKLKQKQESSESNWAAFTKRMASNEHKQQQLRIFLGQIIQLMGEKGELWNGESVKKQRLDPPKSNENLASANQTEKRKNQNQEELIEKVSEANQQVSSPEENEGSPSQEKKTNETSQSLSLALFSGDYYLWEKMLEDELMCENEAQAEAGLATYQSANFLELKDLMTKQPH